jgi:hypothetical protein
MLLGKPATLTAVLTPLPPTLPVAETVGGVYVAARMEIVDVASLDVVAVFVSFVVLVLGTRLAGRGKARRDAQKDNSSSLC